MIIAGGAREWTPAKPAPAQLDKHVSLGGRDACGGRMFPKRHLIALSDRWRTITTAKQAMIVSGVARVQPSPTMTPAKPASVSA